MGHTVRNKNKKKAFAFSQYRYSSQMHLGRYSDLYLLIHFPVTSVRSQFYVNCCPLIEYFL